MGEHRAATDGHLCRGIRSLGHDPWVMPSRSEAPSLGHAGFAKWFLNRRKRQALAICFVGRSQPRRRTDRLSRAGCTRLDTLLANMKMCECVKAARTRYLQSDDSSRFTVASRTVGAAIADERRRNRVGMDQVWKFAI